VIAGKHLAAKTVIWTAGVAASPAGKWIGAETDRAGRAKVNSDLSVPGHPNIFVIGDTASVSQEDGKPVPGVAPAAMQEGHYVASVIADRMTGKEQEQAFHYVDKGNMATIGRFSGIVDVGNAHFAGFLGWILWLVVHLYYLIGFRNRIMVMIQWVVSYLLFQRGARLIAFEDKARIE
jgi:NADH:ubiquinone reductase (H+-translocating)